MVSVVIVLTSAAEVVIAQALCSWLRLLLTFPMLPTPIRFLFGTELLPSPTFYPSNELVV
jgi:hypothetical protein